MKTMVFFAHPDDETILCGGALAALAQDGNPIIYLCATRGEGGERGEPPLCEISETGQVRARELADAVSALGGGKLLFLEYVDPLVGLDNTLYAYCDDPSAVEKKLLLVVEQEKPDLILTHGSRGEYGHPAHVLSHQAMKAVFQQLPDPKPIFCTVGAFFTGHPRPQSLNQDDPADYILDLSKNPACLQAKINAAMCHQTQCALFVRRRSELERRKMTVPEVILTTEGLHRIFPLKFNGSDPLAAIFERTGVLVS